MPQKHSDEELLDDLRRLHRDLGGIPSSDDIKEHSNFSAATYSRRFGGIPDARQAAGLGSGSGHDIRAEYLKISEEKLLDDLRRLSEELDRPPSATEVDKLGNFCKDTYTDRFGSLIDAREQAGLKGEYNFKSEKLSKEKVKIVCNHCGAVEWVRPSRGDAQFCSTDCMGMATRETSTEEIRSKLEELASKLDRSPKVREFDTMTGLYHGVFESRDDLDSFSTELRKLGFDPVAPKDLSDEELLEDLRRLQNKHGRPPRQSDLQDAGKVNSETPYVSRWDSWHNALQEAGIEPANEQLQEIKEKKLIDEFLRVTDELGAVPSYTDIETHANYSAQTYERAFGSFLNAKQAAGFEPEPSNHNQPTGKDHYAWKGGLDPQYGPNWYEQRRKARQRDEFTCQNCGLTKREHLDEYGMLPHVHHITPWDQFEDYKNRNSLGNLVTLCASCHKKVEEMDGSPEF